MSDYVAELWDAKTNIKDEKSEEMKMKGAEDYVWYHFPRRFKLSQRHWPS